jgi:hypothetical protein
MYLKENERKLKDARAVEVFVTPTQKRGINGYQFKAKIIIFWKDGETLAINGKYTNGGGYDKVPASVDIAAFSNPIIAQEIHGTNKTGFDVFRDYLRSNNFIADKYFNFLDELNFLVDTYKQRGEGVK